MKYKIKINYDTGDSFNSYQGEESELELEWDNMDVAKQNLQRIKAHYQLCLNTDNLSDRKKYKELVDAAKEEDWFTDETTFKYTIKLKTDTGNDWQIHTFWCGYFERLNYAMIIPLDSDLIISF